MALIESLIDQLNDKTSPKQAAAAEQLAQLGAEAHRAIPALVRGCGCGDEDVQNWCVAALEEAGKPTGAQIDDLTSLAASANADIAFWAVTMLGHAGSIAGGAAEALVGRLQDPASPTVQQRAAWALGRIGPLRPDALAALKDAAAETGPIAAHAQRALDRAQAA